MEAPRLLSKKSQLDMTHLSLKVTDLQKRRDLLTTSLNHNIVPEKSLR